MHDCGDEGFGTLRKGGDKHEYGQFEWALAVADIGECASPLCEEEED